MNIYEPVLIAIATVVSGFLTYVAWMEPKRHRKMLSQMSRIYGGWSPASAEWFRSEVNFWITRLAYSLGFLISILAGIEWVK